MIPYIKYFFFLAFNWNFRIAFYILRQEIKGEKKYGIHTTGADELKALEKKGIDILHATIYMPVSYQLMEELLVQLKETECNHFLDIGCGKGRALCVAAHHGFKKVTGIDFSKELCEAATDNLQLTQQKFPSLQYSIIHNDAFYFEIPDTVNCIFLFNPFDEIILSGVVNNLNASLKKNPRKISILYVNPLHKELLLHAGFHQTWFCTKLKYLEAVILNN